MCSHRAPWSFWSNHCPCFSRWKTAFELMSMQCKHNPSDPLGGKLRARSAFLSQVQLMKSPGISLQFWLSGSGVGQEYLIFYTQVQWRGCIFRFGEAQRQGRDSMDYYEQVVPLSVPSLAGALPGCRTHAAQGCGTSRTILTTPVHREASCHWFSFCDSSRVSLSGQLIYGRASCHVSCFGLATQLSWVNFLPS